MSKNTAAGVTLCREPSDQRQRTDPLGLYVPTPFHTDFLILGIPLRVEAATEHVMNLAKLTFGRWGAPAGGSNPPALTLRLFSDNQGSYEARHPGPAVSRAQRDYLLVAAHGSTGFADRAGGFACGYISDRALVDPASVSRDLIECLGLYLVTRELRGALHAAAVVWEDQCVLLTGAAGSGKSTLAYACLKSGFSLLAEDLVYARAAGSTVWGSPWAIHLLPDSTRFFPELGGRQPSRTSGGERRISVDAGSAGELCTSASVSAVLHLVRSGVSAPRISPGGRAEAFHSLTSFAPDRGPEDAAAMYEGAERVLETRVGVLMSGPDPLRNARFIRSWLCG